MAVRVIVTLVDVVVYGHPSGKSLWVVVVVVVYGSPSTTSWR